ncbi:ATP-binding protein [Alloprevotella tannerae]|uniref:AAA family ATPase n=1 Tax=Alloprevotella tannerae TaxID=76122 RepID=UPI0028E3EEE2|nr:ATP-binding protein [Alloprevotella tannerae]
MLVNFTVKNHRSFKQERTFSMEASSIKEHKASVIRNNKYNLLPLTIFYGANSSGKSNLIKAIATMRYIIEHSVRLNVSDTLPYDPFALDEDSNSQPTLFEIQFINGEALYRYGFEYNDTTIISEWLYEKRFGEKEYDLFVRSRDAIAVSPKRFPEGKGKEDLTNSNRLFLSLVAQLKGEKSNSIMSWFGQCNLLSGIDSDGYENFTIKMFLEHLNGSDEAQSFFNTLQLGFSNFFVEKVNIPKEVLDKAPDPIKAELEKGLAEGKIVESITTHNIYDENGQVIGKRNFHKDEMESEGTKKVIELSGPIFNTLNKGKILIIDELDAKLHPLLTRNIVLLFMDPEKNKHGAQLIFATHDTNLLDLDIIRRDQIWFAEKDQVESTDIYSLVEFKDEEGKKIRNDRDIKRDYIRGRYGAIPFIGK